MVYVSPAMSATGEPPIDAVYTWVDGARLPDLDVWLERMSGQLSAVDVGPCRWRDNGELRFSLRALEAHAPWIRTVHLVTHGQVPEWLDPDAAGLNVVSHDELFPDPAVLPSFNSAAIVSVIHRIEGLANRYLYFNDDVILGRDVQPDDFFTEDGGTRVYVEPWPPPSSLGAPTIVDRQLAFNRLRLGLPSPFMLAHSPQPFQRSLLAAAWARWRPDLERTLTHRFRATDDALLQFLYFNGLLASGPPHEAVVNHDGLTPLVRVHPRNNMAYALEALRGTNPLSFCVNDEIDDLATHGSKWDEVRAFLDDRLPRPSRWEK
jgi:hypothetical protein